MSKHDTAPRPASHTITCDYYGRLATGWSCPRLIEQIFEKLGSLNFLYQATDILERKRFVSYSQLNNNNTHGNTPMHTSCHRAARDNSGRGDHSDNHLLISAAKSQKMRQMPSLHHHGHGHDQQFDLPPSLSMIMRVCQ